MDPRPARLIIAPNPGQPRVPAPALEQIVRGRWCLHALSACVALHAEACSARLQNAEIFTLTYGSIVRQLITDYEDLEEVNKQLDQMCAAVSIVGLDHAPRYLHAALQGLQHWHPAD
jgi:hypothetical protein